MMEAFDISQDDDESDTSQEDIADADMFDSVEDFDTNFTELKLQEFKRTPVPTDLMDELKDFNFFLMDCDFGIISTERIPSDLIPNSGSNRLPSICKEQSYMRLHGITESGNSICCNVFGFLPYFYAAPSIDFTEENVHEFKDLLTKAVIKKILTSLSAVPYHDMIQNSPIVSVDIFDTNSFSNIYDFHASKKNDSGSRCGIGTTNVLKITCSMPKFVWTVAKILKCNEIKFPESCRYEIYEAAINHTIRFLSDTNLSACTWLQIITGNYTIRSGQTKLSQAQLEIDVYYENLGKVSPGEDLADTIPPIKILSFDIECMVRPNKYSFPKDGSDLVLQIGNVLATYGSSDVPRKIVFALGECSKSEATEILSFQNEKEMLEAWRAFIISTDPDILMGYNIRKFDIPYLVDRANAIGLNRFPFLGRVKASPSVVRPVKPGPKQVYAYDEKKVVISGRVILDMYLLMMRHNTIPGKCSLADVCVRYLKTERKIDVHYTDIFRMQNLSNQTRTSLAEYCIQDAALPYLLLQSHNPNRIRNPTGDMLNYYIDKSRRTGTPIKYLITKSKAYGMYFRMVRTQKNPNVQFVPDTPTPVKSKSLRSSEPSVSPGKEFSPKRLNFDDSSTHENN